MRKPKYALSLYYQRGKSDAIKGLDNFISGKQETGWTKQEQAEYKYGRAAGIRQLKYATTDRTEKQKAQQLHFRQLGLLTRTQAGLIQAEKDFGFYWSSRDVLYLQQAVITLQQQVARIRANK